MKYNCEFNDFLMTAQEGMLGMFHHVKEYLGLTNKTELFVLFLTLRKLQHVAKILKNGSVG